MLQWKRLWRLSAAAGGKLTADHRLSTRPKRARTQRRLFPLLLLMTSLFFPASVSFLFWGEAAVHSRYAAHRLRILSLLNISSPRFLCSACVRLIATSIMPSFLFLTASLSCSACCFLLHHLSYCLVTFVSTPPQSLFAVWYQKERRGGEITKADLLWTDDFLSFLHKDEWELCEKCGFPPSHAIFVNFWSNLVTLFDTFRINPHHGLCPNT